MGMLKLRLDHILLLAAAGAAILYVEWHTDEVTVVLALLILAAAGVGFARPAGFVATGLLLGGAIGAAHALSTATGYLVPRYQVSPPSPQDLAAMALLVVPALLAAACGAGLRRALPGD